MSVEKTVKLNSGYDMPTLGLGTFTVWQNPEGQMARVISAAVKAGYRHIDTAKIYGTEPLIGPVLTQLIESGEIKREEVFITCKVWCTDHKPENVKKSLEQSLKDLQTTYVDMLLIHWPMSYQAGDELFPKDADGELIHTEDDYVDTWKAMEECVESGQVRSIGLSNFNIEQMMRVYDIAKIKPSNHQVELNAQMTNKEVADWCKKKGMVVSCYAPLGSPGRPWKQDGEPDLLEEPVVIKLAEKYKKTRAQVLLRHLLQKGYVVLPKSVTETRLAENIDVYDFTIADDDVAKLDTLNRDLRVYSEPIAVKNPYYPF
ncbi:aldo-keto reductase family 1 member B1-like [Watersipora subatra]|uniref:aldo-keto reductase family 1 member B1-like n=1 Tax=Watersipora subatra TaxID=2589382 RepID=UPI00355BF8C3